jgi:hypothetical protein
MEEESMKIWLTSSSCDEKQAKGKRLVDWIAREKSEMPDLGTYRMISVGRQSNKESLRVVLVTEPVD